MGVCRSLANSCRQSGHGVIFCVRLLEKYRAGLHLELSKAESEYVPDQFRSEMSLPLCVYVSLLVPACICTCSRLCICLAGCIGCLS